MIRAAMGWKGRAAALVAVQAALVLSIAGKYWYERKTCPRVWVRTAEVDPNLPLRGRYLALQLAVDACGLPRDDAHFLAPGGPRIPRERGTWRWPVRPVAKDGKLVAQMAGDGDQDRPEVTDTLTQWPGRSCDRAALSKHADYFIPDTAKSPFPLKRGEELWVEVTVPPVGPPRPIQLAISKDGVFTPLGL
jgi:hypothetical protein